MQDFISWLLQAFASAIYVCVVAIYICVVAIFGVKVNLVCSKTKVAPMKDLSISLLGLLSFLTKSLQSVMNGFIFWFHKHILMVWFNDSITLDKEYL